VKRIQLVNGRGVALVDDCDWERVRGFRWYALRLQTCYARTYFRGADGKKITVYLHRLIMNAGVTT
jgi:hypothetical protein